MIRTSCGPTALSRISSGSTGYSRRMSDRTALLVCWLLLAPGPLLLLAIIVVQAVRRR